MKRLIFSSLLVLTPTVIALSPAQASCIGRNIIDPYNGRIGDSDRYTSYKYVPPSGSCILSGGRGTSASPSPTYSVSNPSALSSSVSFPIAEGMAARVQTLNGGVLNQRSGASLSSNVIGTFSSSNEVILSGVQQGGWVELQGGGWVHSDYLQPA